MPQTFPNMYGVQTPIGQGLQNIAQMLLADDGGAKARLNAAHQAQYDAQARMLAAQEQKLTADAEQTRAQTEGSQNFLKNSTRNIVGDDVAEQTLRFLQGATETIPAHADEAQQMTVAPTTARVQRPANLGADQEQQIRRLMGIAAGAQANGQLNMDNVAKALGEVSKTQAYDGVLNGSVDPSRFTLANGKPLFHFGENGSGNLVTGAQQLNGLGQARVATEGSKQVLDRAQAGNANASAGAHNRSNQLVELPNPMDGGKTKIRIPADIYYQQTNANSRNDANIAGRQGVVEAQQTGATERNDANVTGRTAVAGMRGGPAVKLIKTNKGDMEAIDAALNSGLGADDSFPIDASDPSNVMLHEIATRLFSTPGGPGYANPNAAARLAIEQMGATGAQSGDWNPLKPNRTQVAVTKPAAEAAPDPTAQPSGAPQAAIDLLRKNPSMATAFKQKYGYLP